MRRGIRRFRRPSRAKGYDWIVTVGDQMVTMLNPATDPTLAEFPLITPTEVAEVGAPILVERVVGSFWATSPFRSGETNGAAMVAWGVRVADVDSLGAYLPANPLQSVDMDISWMFLRSHLLGNIGVPQFQALPVNLFPNVGPGGRHAPQGGPSIDINVKRKMGDRETLTLSASWNSLVTWVGPIVENYDAADQAGVYLHIRTLVRAAGR